MNSSRPRPLPLRSAQARKVKQYQVGSCLLGGLDGINPVYSFLHCQFGVTALKQESD